MSFFRFDNDKKSFVETVEAANPTFATQNGNYSIFQHGATYSYTDGSKVNDFKNGTIDTDTTTVTIDRTVAHGTKKTPYVIENYDQWITFATENGIAYTSDGTYQFGYGKVWVLAVDIEFNTTDKPFLPLWGFGGEFYGLGHTLHNATYDMANMLSNWQTNVSGMGVFCNTYQGGLNVPTSPVVIADLNLEGYKFTNCGLNVGAIAGRCFAAQTWVMNCHAQGTLDRSTGGGNGCYAIWGGLVGGSFNSDSLPNDPSMFQKDIFIYRCSVKTEMNIKEALTCQDNAAVIGGILGISWLRGNVTVWDCYAETTLETSGFAVVSIGGIIGILPSNDWNFLSSHSIRDCVNTLTYNFAGWGASSTGSVFTMGGAFTFQAGGDADGPVTYNYDRYHNVTGIASGNICTPTRTSVSVSNTYSVNTFNYTDGPSASYLDAGNRFAQWYPTWTGRTTERTWYDSFCTVSSSNNFYAGTNDFLLPPDTASAMDLASAGSFSVAAGSSVVSSDSGLYNKAKNDTVDGKAALNEKIWENKDNIGGTYTTATSPVKNSKVSPVYKIEYFNLKKDGTKFVDEAISGVSTKTYTYGTMSGAFSLAGVPDTSTRKFLGWTRDTSGKSTPVKKIDEMEGMNGNMKFYAVWEVLDSSATLSTLNGDTSVESGNAIYLRATINTPTITNPEITYKFKKDGTVVFTATGKDNNEYVIDSKDQNGDYTLEYEVYDKEYPLMSHTGSSSNTLSLEITGKTATFKSFTIDASTPAYPGRALSTLSYQLVMLDGITPVPGTAAWDTPRVTVKDGKNKAKLWFTPTDSTNYKPVPVDVEFESVDLTLTFHMVDMPSFDFDVVLDYNTDYDAADIVKLFEEGYLEQVTKYPSFDESVAGGVPKLDGVEINDYTTDLLAVTTPQTINVTFTAPKPFNVVLDYDCDIDGDDSIDKTGVKVNWNKLIPAKYKSPTRGEDYRFDGWFVTQSDGTVTTTQWDFDNDRVTDDLTLTAGWTQITYTLQYITVHAPIPFEVTALTTVKGLGITVEATYSSNISPDPIVKNIPLNDGSNGGFDVYIDSVPANPNTELHVGDANLKVEFETFSQSYAITVNPIRLSNKIKFPACVKEYTGVAQDIDFSLNLFPEDTRKHISTYDITYTEKVSGDPVTNVINIGVYIATVTFVMKDADHEILPIQARFTICAPRTPVTVSWDSTTSFTYTGEVQHPTATLTATVDGSSVTLADDEVEYVIHKSGILDEGKDAGVYTVEVVFAESVESTYKFVGGAPTSKTYTITRAKVSKPTASITSFVYDGSAQIFTFDDFDDSYMSYSSDSITSATDAGTYTVRVELDNNHEWDSVGTAKYTWTITPKTIARPTFELDPMEYTGYNQTVTDFVVGFDEETMSIAGDVKKVNAGNYTARVTPTANYTWDNASTPVTLKWTIEKATLYIVWEDTDTYFYDKSSPSTKYSPKIVALDGLCGEDTFNPETDITYSGEKDKSAVGAYIVQFGSLKASLAANYTVAQDAGKGYRIIPVGADLNDPTLPQVPDVTGGSTGNNSTSNSNGGGNANGNGGADGEGDLGGFISILPQIIIIAISLILIIVFTIMTLNYASATKAAKEKTQKLAKVTYSFAPVGLLVAAGTFGLSGTAWWAIAGVLAACALVMGIVTFLFRGKKVKAVAMLEEEQERVAEEKELAKEEKLREEQRRRDNEMRMMFASMQQNYQQPQFDDAHLQNLISSTVTALLPAIQQQMALPPASSMTNESQYEINALHSQIEELNRRLNDQQAQQRELAEALYEEPAVVDDTSWLGDSDEVVSLEDSYGGLSDDEKRFYYEIGSYIMNKPRTSQNDGKYAVLFKYRGKTVFKLCIIDDAPVLYYPAGGGRSEVRISNPAALELAKSVIDRQIVRVDSEM